MVVISQKRFPGQDGRPTHPKLVKALREHHDLTKIPHQYFFPESVLKNLIKVKRMVLKNKEAYLRSGGGNKMTSFVMIVEGKSSSGKSTIASQLGIFFDPQMTLEKNYAWTMKRLLQLIENPKPGQAIILDEGMIFNSRKANSQDNIKLIVALSQVRSKGVFFIVCINSVHQLEKSIPLSRADFLVRVKRIGGMTGTPKYCIYDEDGMRNLIVKNAGKYSYAGVYPNIGWTTFSRYFPFNDVRYDKMKHRESSKNINEETKRSVLDNKIRMGIARLVEHCKKEYGMSYAQAAKITKVTLTSIENYRRNLSEEKENAKS